MKKIERLLLKKKLKYYLAEVLAGEETYDSFEKCQREVVRVEGTLTAHNASEWLRGLPIGVDYSTWNICVKMFNILGWKFDPLFSLGRVSVEHGNLKFGVDTFDMDCLYWQILGEIIAEYETDWQRYIKYLHEWADTHSDEKFGGQSPVCFDEWCDNEKEYEDD